MPAIRCIPWHELRNGVSDVEFLTKVTYKVRIDYLLTAYQLRLPSNYLQ